MLIFFLIILIIGIFLLFKFRKNNNISKKDILFFKKQLKIIKSSSNYKSKIIDYDKLYHKILLKFGYEGSFGEILKMKPIEISNLNKIWDLHKIRNKLVHDFDLFSEKKLKINSLEYHKEIIKIINKKS